MIKGSKMLTHPDEVSGTTVFPDGTKVYWTEGRSSEAFVLKADGKKLSYPVCAPLEGEVLYINALEIYVEEQGAEEVRVMTQEEEVEWAKARGVEPRFSHRRQAMNEPRYKHTSPSCKDIFLGQYKKFDLYLTKTCINNIVARYGNDVGNIQNMF